MSTKKPMRERLKLAENEILVFMEDYHHDGCDRVIKVTTDEWDRMTAEAREKGYPIDGATVDWEVLGPGEGFDRTDYRRKITAAELDEIEHVIPLV